MKRAATQLLDGRYQITQTLGRLGYARLFAACHIELDIPVRIAAWDHGGDPSSSSGSDTKFQSRMSLIMSLRHPALPRVRDWFVRDGHFYVVMDDPSGEMLAARRSGERRDRLSDALRVGLQLCDVVTYLAAAAPELTPLGTIAPNYLVIRPTVDVVVTALPLGRWLGLEAASITASPSPFTAPETTSGQAWDARTDVYSIGTVLHTLLVGTPRSAGIDTACPHLLERDLELPRALVWAVGRALSTDPMARFDSARDFGTALAIAAYDVLPAVVSPPTPTTLAPGTNERMLPAASQSRGGVAESASMTAHTSRGINVLRWPHGKERKSRVAERHMPIRRTGERALAALSSALHLSA
jgi:serine/threonine-protein kinase